MSSALPISIIVAIAGNDVIGRDGGMPWRLSTDMRRFKANSMGNPVIMGRRHDSIGKPLQAVSMLSLPATRTGGPKGLNRVSSLQAAITLANVRGRCMPEAKEICVIGGGQIYAEALPLADRLIVTHVLADIEG